jgi:hypothetical protein
MTPEHSSLALVPRSNVIRLSQRDLGSDKKNASSKATRSALRTQEMLVGNLWLKMQKKMFRCGESNPDLLGESEKS